MSRGFGSADYVGAIPLGQAAVGLAASPDGRWLYATSEGATPAQHPVGIRASPARGGPALSAAQAARAGIMPHEPPGTLTLIDLQGRRPTRRTRSWPPSMPAASRSA